MKGHENRGWWVLFCKDDSARLLPGGWVLRRLCALLAEASLCLFLQAGIRVVVVLVLGMGVLGGTALSPWWVLLLPPLEDSFMPGRLLAGLGWVVVWFFWSCICTYLQMFVVAETQSLEPDAADLVIRSQMVVLR